MKRLPILKLHCALLNNPEKGNLVLVNMNNVQLVLELETLNSETPNSRIFFMDGEMKTLDIIETIEEIESILEEKG